MCHLPLAWLPVPSRFRRITATLHRESSDLPHARGGEPGLHISIALATGHAGGTFPNRGRIEGRESCAMSPSFTLDIYRYPSVSRRPFVGWSLRSAFCSPWLRGF